MSFCKFTFCPFVENEVIGNLHGLEILSIGSFAGLEILSTGSSLLSGHNKWNDLWNVKSTIWGASSTNKV